VREEDNFDGLIIGTLFTVASLLLTLTFFIPIISVFPGVIVEALAKEFVHKDPYNNVGKATITLLTILFVIFLLITLFKIRQTVLRDGKISKAKIAVPMTVIFFIVHSLGFYIYWGLVLNYRSDGQLIFAAVDSFPKSSWTIIPIGMIIDVTKNFKRQRIT
jgi:uncharacterized BrkB/YihY/UPF0761 family membrane protein